MGKALHDVRGVGLQSVNAEFEESWGLAPYLEGLWGSELQLEQDGDIIGRQPVYHQRHSVQVAD